MAAALPALAFLLHANDGNANLVVTQQFVGLCPPGQENVPPIGTIIDPFNPVHVDLVDSLDTAHPIPAHVEDNASAKRIKRAVDTARILIRAPFDFFFFPTSISSIIKSLIFYLFVL
jgi:hypothetical protein